MQFMILNILKKFIKGTSITLVIENEIKTEYNEKN